MKYSKGFERDYAWYLQVSNIFNFDGKMFYTNKKGVPLVQEDLKKGKSAKYCFYFWESFGKINTCKEPSKLKKLLKTKGSVNLHMKTYAQDRARGYLPLLEFNKICEEVCAPSWFRKGVENAKHKYYD